MLWDEEHGFGIDIPVWAPITRARYLVTHFHADHLAGLVKNTARRRSQLYAANVQQAVLLMMSLKLFKVDKLVVPARFPLRVDRNGRIKVYHIRVIHTFESYNYLVVDKAHEIAILYTPDIRTIPDSSLAKLKKILEREEPRRLVVLGDATYFSDESVKPPDSGLIIDPGRLVEMAEKGPVLMPVLSTGRWASVLRVLETQGYRGDVRIIGYSLRYMIENLMGRFKQTREEMEYYPLKKPRRITLTLMDRNTAAEMLATSEPGIYMVAGGMVQSYSAQYLAAIAIKQRVPIVLSCSQLPGTPGAKLLASGKAYKLEDPRLHGHITPGEWLLLASKIDNIHGDVVYIPVHTSLKGARAFTETMKEAGHRVGPYQVARYGSVDVVLAQIGRFRVMSGIAPEEHDLYAERQKIVFSTVYSYTPVHS